MSVLAFGLNYRTAPVGLLDRLAVPADRLGKALDDLLGRDHITEAVVLSTCNRVEVYAAVTRYHGGLADLRNFASEWAGVAPDDIAPLAYDYFEERAAGHLFAVATGLDSMVVGERQIHAQVRQAFKDAEAYESTGRLLGALFRQAMRVAKRARVETNISSGGATMVDVGLAAAERALGAIDGCGVLVVGAGKMGGVAAGRLAERAGTLRVANRSAERAERLAKRTGAQFLPLDRLRDGLADVDLVITSTGAGEPVITYADVDAAMAGRGDRRLVLLDLAVPRDIDPAVAGIPGVTVLDIEAVRTLTDAGPTAVVLDRARTMVDEAAASFAGWTRTVQVDPTIAALRTRAEAVRAAEVDRLAGRLTGLDERQREAVEALSKRIVATLLHEPTVRLTRIADYRGAELYASALHELFDLPGGEPPAVPGGDPPDPPAEPEARDPGDPGVARDPGDASDPGARDTEPPA